MKKIIPIVFLLTTVIILLILSILVVTGKVDLTNDSIDSNSQDTKEDTVQFETYPGVSYEATSEFNLNVEIFAEDIGQVTRMIITPDSKIMLVSTLQGDIFAFKKDTTQDTFIKQEKPFFSVDTGLDGFPRENGLTGIAFAADFEESKEIFLSYAALDGNEELKNRVSRLTLSTDTSGDIIGTNFEQIFEGNIESASAHQIQGGVGIMLNGKSHYLFPIGDAFESSKAKDPSVDAGKLMLIQRDGSNPEGSRPYPENPKVQAVGIRNTYEVTDNPFDFENFIFVDTANGENDKLVYGNLIAFNGFNFEKLNFNWEGKDEDQLLPIEDVYKFEDQNMNLFQWNPTNTPLDFQFINGGFGDIPETTESEQYFLLTIFGVTSSTSNTPGKKIVLGKLSNLDSQPDVEFSDVIVRVSEADGFLGHPTAITLDPESNTIYFADIIEGRIYIAN